MFLKPISVFVGLHVAWLHSELGQKRNLVLLSVCTYWLVIWILGCVSLCVQRKSLGARARASAAAAAAGRRSQRSWCPPQRPAPRLAHIQMDWKQCIMQPLSIFKQSSPAPTCRPSSSFCCSTPPALGSPSNNLYPLNFFPPSSSICFSTPPPLPPQIICIL